MNFDLILLKLEKENNENLTLTKFATALKFNLNNKIISRRLCEQKKIFRFLLVNGPLHSMNMYRSIISLLKSVRGSDRLDTRKFEVNYHNNT